MDMDNPFQPPQSEGPGDREESQDLVTLRRAHLGHELAIREVATVYALAAAGLLWLTFEAYLRHREWSGGLPILFGAAGIACAWAFSGLRQLAAWSRWPVFAVALLGLVLSPLFIPLNAYGLYLVFSEKGQRILSPEYRRIVPRVPAESKGFAWRLALWLFLALSVGLALLSLAISSR